MEKSSIVAIDLAKSSFAVHIANKEGRMLKQHKKVSRARLRVLIGKLPPSRIAMEACGSAHHWARVFRAAGHEISLIAPQFVKPYVKANKNDANDAAAIAEAASRQHMNFVSVKTLQQQDMKMLHSIRSRLVTGKVCLTNQIRGILYEYGITVPQGDGRLRAKLADLLDESSTPEENCYEEITGLLKGEIREIREELVSLEAKIAAKDAQIKELCNQDESIKELMKIPGIGHITASAIVAHAGNASTFSSGRQFAAYFGLTPNESSTGGKTRLGGISKRGDKTIRTLLIHGARAVLSAAKFVKEANFEKWSASRSRSQKWAQPLAELKGLNRAAVALANKHARIIWVILSKGAKYQPDHISARPARAA